ncbi:MAG: peptidase dimerization domain protein, partial [Tunicatimonas sp.]
MSNFQTYVEQNQDRFLDELFDLLRIPSVSTDSKFADDVRRTADFLKERLVEAKFDNDEVVET